MCVGETNGTKPADQKAPEPQTPAEGTPVVIAVLERIIERRGHSWARALDDLDIAELDERIAAAEREIAAAQALKILARQWQAGRDQGSGVGGQEARSASDGVAKEEESRPRQSDPKACFCQRILDAIDEAADGQVNRWISPGVIAARTKLSRATVLETLVDLREHIELNAEGEVRLKQSEPASATAD